MSFYDEFDDDKYYSEKFSKKTKTQKQKKFKDYSEDDFENKKGKLKTSHERKLNRSLKNNE